MADSKRSKDQFNIFKADGANPDGKPISIPQAPPWRRFREERERRFGSPFVVSEEVKTVVNAALHLRRPILITGHPGTGKSSVAYAVAEELGLGPVLKWAINSRSSLREGLYQYDAIARLQDFQMKKDQKGKGIESIGNYITLGPLGTAMIASMTGKPCVLLIDEIDKSDVDLPNDLLHTFEDGYFDIQELLRLPPEQRRSVEVFIEREVDGTRKRVVRDGTVPCQEFPFIVLTSNGERELPPAFHRRCLRLKLELPSDTEELKTLLSDVIDRHLKEYKSDLNEVEVLIEKFASLQADQQSTLAVDQLLQAVFITRLEVKTNDEQTKLLKEMLLQDLRG